MIDYLLLVDGIFHLFGTEQNFIDYGPDYQIAGVFGKKGLPVYAHRIMGLFLVLSSVYSLTGKKEDCYIKVYKSIIVPISLLVIGLGVLLFFIGVK